jgi:arginine utilization regulatory protein
MKELELDNVDYLSVLRDLDEGIIITDRKGVIVYYNPAMAKIDDLEPEYPLGKKVIEVYDLTDDTSVIMECLKNGRPIVNRHLFYRTRLGKVANTIHRVFPLFSGERLIGAVCFVRDYHVLAETIASIAMPNPKSERDNGTIYTFEDIIGDHPAFLRAVNTAMMAANSPSPIMLYGETGTGKELLAQSIHNHSVRKRRPYIPINCAAIPENLLEGILFGTSKGAFTGALNKPGLFERASGGSLLLDEVNSMPVNLQVKMLRVLQEKKVRRVGSLTEIDIDLKVISSVNKEPHRAIEEGSLRPDLFYRLGVVFIPLPPLRERREDIDKLVHHFLKKHGRSLAKTVPRVSEEVMALFNCYHWPGNVRELEHFIESGMNLAVPGESLALHHLQGYFRGQFNNWLFQNNSDPLLQISASESQPAPKSLVEIQAEREKNVIIQALEICGGNVSKAARRMGISRQLLRYKMIKYELDRKDFA